MARRHVKAAAVVTLMVEDGVNERQSNEPQQKTVGLLLSAPATIIVIRRTVETNGPNGRTSVLLKQERKTGQPGAKELSTEKSILGGQGFLRPSSVSDRQNGANKGISQPGDP